MHVFCGSYDTALLCLLSFLFSFRFLQCYLILTGVSKTQTINIVLEFNSLVVYQFCVRGGAISSVQVRIVVQIKAHFLFGNLIALLLSDCFFCPFVILRKKMMYQKDRIWGRFLCPSL